MPRYYRESNPDTGEFFDIVKSHYTIRRCNELGGNGITVIETIGPFDENTKNEWIEDYIIGDGYGIVNGGQDTIQRFGKRKSKKRKSKKRKSKKRKSKKSIKRYKK